MKTKQKIKILLLALTAAVILSSCSFKDSSKITIGGIGPMEGEVAVYGVSSMNGAELALENKKILGKDVEFIILNDNGDSKEAVKSYYELTEEKDAVAIIGAVTSGATASVAYAASKNFTPVITPSATALYITDMGNSIFRACCTDPYQGQVMAEFAADKLGARTAAVIYNIDNDYSVGLSESFKESFEAKGGTVSCYEIFSEGDKDFSQQLDRIKQADTDVIFVPNYTNETYEIAKQAYNKQIKAVFLGSDGWEGITEMADVDKYLKDGCYCTSFTANDESEDVQNFVASYKEKYGEEPSAFSALGYDSAMVMAEAIERAGSVDSAEIINALRETNYQGITGNFTFDEKGNPIKVLPILKISESGTELYK